MTIKEIDQRLEDGLSMMAIAQAYSEIANLKIKKIRANVERNRLFFQEISRVYTIIRKFAIKKKLNMNKPKKTISIVLTSNHGFYGAINSKLLEFFIKSTKKIDTDRIYLGSAAIDYFKAQPSPGNYQEVLLKNDQPSAGELKTMVDTIKDYNQVLVFYSGMKSLLVQQPVMIDITASGSPPAAGRPLANSQQPTANSEDFKFIFEPELPKILEFFDSQITTLLLEAAFLEAELSRTASRFVSMDAAESASMKFIKECQTLKAFVKRSMNNNKILENFATMMAVRKETQS